MINKMRLKVTSLVLVFTMTAVILQGFVAPLVPYANDKMTALAAASNPVISQINPSEDTYVRSGGNANTNFGSSTTLGVKSFDADININRQAFMKYDLSTFTGEIGSAKLKIYAIDTENSTIGVQLFGMEDDAWKGNTVTWNTKPIPEHYITNINVGKIASWYEIDVTAFVKKQKALDQTVSFAFLEQAAKGHAVNINSVENTENRPYLEISADRVNASAPNWPSGGSVNISNVSATSLQLNWSAAADPTGVTSYTIYQNGNVIGTVGGSVTSYTVTGLQVGQKVTFTVESGNALNQWSNDGPYVTVTLPNPKQTVLLPLEDTYVRGGGNANDNYGTSALLGVKNFAADANLNRQAYMKYDLNYFASEIASAKLKIYAIDTENSTIGVQVFGMENDSWKANTVTWNTKPGPDTYIANIDVGKTAGWYEIDVTAFVKRQKALDQTVSFAFLEQAAQGHAVQINSMENTVNRPYLELSTYRVNANAPNWPSGGSLTVSDLNETGMQLNWSAAADPVGVTGYKIYQNGIVLGTVAGTASTYTVTGLQIDQKYTFKVEAVNGLNQWSTDGPFITTMLPSTKLVQLRPGNVFIDHEAIQFKVITTRPNVAWTVYDYQGAAVSAGNSPVAQGESIVTVPFTKFGYFTLQIKVESNNSDPITIKTPFAVLSPLDQSGRENSPFGMATHLHRIPPADAANMITMMKYAGIDMVRDGREWNSIEKQKGSYTFSPSPDDYMAKLNDDHFDFTFVSGFNNPFYDNNSTPYTDEGREGFANYVKAYADHYDGQLDAVEVFNEFNGSFGDRGNGPADSKPENYFPLLKKTYETVKAAHPDTPVVGMVMAIDLNWMEKVFQLGGMQYLDVISVHPYVYPGEPERLESQINGLKDLIRTYNNGQLKPIWISETGWPTQLDSRGVDEQKQANYLIRGYVVSIANGIDKIMWYDFMNDGVQLNYNEDNFGIIRNTNDKLGAYTPKPAYAAYATMSRALGGAQFVSKDSTDTDIRSYVFDKDGEQIRALWAVGSSVPAVIHTVNSIQITDMMGNTDTYVPHNGNVYVTLNDEPYFIKGDISGVEKDSTFSLHGDPARVGDPIKLTLETDNTTSAPYSFNFKVEGESYPVFAEGGQKVTQMLTVSNLNEPGTRLVKGFLMKGNDKIGMIRSTVTALQSYEVKVRPIIADVDTMSKTLQIQINNLSTTKGLQVKRVEWKFGTQSGMKEFHAEVKSSSAEVFDIPLTGYGLGVTNALKVTVYFDDYDPFTYEGTAEFNPIRQGTVNVDGALDSETAAASSTIDLSKGTVKMTGYQGANDLSGKFWLNFDSNRLYITARVKDNTNSAPFTGADIYKNDSFQFAISNGLPGESLSWYEYGISQTPNGPQIYRWITPPGVSKGLVTNGDLVVTRDENQHDTIYELALPWSELTPIKAERNGVISFSLLVNDNDGNGRKGWIEWGGGIGDGKLSNKFRSMQWVVTDDTPPTTFAALTGTKHNDWYVSDVKVNLSATDDRSAVTESVYSLNGGATWQPYTQELRFAEDGAYTLLYRSTDAVGNVEQAKSIAFKIDQTSPIVQISGVGTFTVDQNVKIACSATDSVSGIVYSDCNGLLVDSPAYMLGLGTHQVSATAEDAAGNTTIETSSYTIQVSGESLMILTQRFVTGAGSNGVINSLVKKLEHSQYGAYVNEISAQKGKRIPNELADILIELAHALE
ncbi:DNRLRE domain-containing protein [Paenibacillus sp. N3.4]|uniref:CBM96 family carbohydrate-binding protein n=1 Tax=Paenibacillus sp. N3.4 TaxID=2603222 RepID=UPI0011C825A0|nr:DNRLRE domain-containing protein [Paenibacillus sp. N3.4]TXK77178.1 DNRLRE domain-containing protein [Paenibacillus sp. N3.4]